MQMDQASARTALLSSRSDELIATMIQVLKSHRHQGGWLTIHQMSKLANISVRSLQRRIAGEGMTFSGLVQTAREQLAVELMDGKALSVSEITTELGYSKISNFSRAFRRWTGRSPTDFRRQEGKSEC